MIKTGDRVKLLAFKDGEAGLDLIPEMQEDVGKEAEVSALYDDQTTLVGGWYWPLSAMEPV